MMQPKVIVACQRGALRGLVQQDAKHPQNFAPSIASLKEIHLSKRSSENNKREN